MPWQDVWRGDEGPAAPRVFPALPAVSQRRDTAPLLPDGRGHEEM